MHQHQNAETRSFLNNKKKKYATQIQQTSILLLSAIINSVLNYSIKNFRYLTIPRNPRR